MCCIKKYKGYNLELLFIVQYLYALVFAILISDAFCSQCKYVL